MQWAKKERKVPIEDEYGETQAVHATTFFAALRNYQKGPESLSHAVE